MGNRDWEIPDDRDHLVGPGFAEDGRDGSIRDHRDLVVWQKGMDLTVLIYEATSKFPREELYGLRSQLRRAAVSIPANIAEGYGRETTGAYVQFLRISQGSAKEVQTLIELATRLGFIPAEENSRLDADVVGISKMLRSLIRVLEQKMTV